MRRRGGSTWRPTFHRTWRSSRSAGRDKGGSPPYALRRDRRRERPLACQTKRRRSRAAGWPRRSSAKPSGWLAKTKLGEAERLARQDEARRSRAAGWPRRNSAKPSRWLAKTKLGEAERSLVGASGLEPETS